MLIYFIVGLIAGLIGANMAKGRGQNPAVWFILCFLFPIAILGLFFLEKKVEEVDDVVEKVEKNKYTFELKRSDDINFENIKKLASDFYAPKGFTDIDVDNETTYLVSTPNGNSYYEIKDYYKDYIVLSVFNADRPDFVDDLLKPKETLNDSSGNKDDKTAKLIELANMLEKGLLSQEEFEKMKKELMA